MSRSHVPGNGLPLLTVSGLMWLVNGQFRIKGVSLGVRAGQIVGLVGREGSGKSSTLALIAGLAVPTLGSVMIHSTIRRNGAGVGELTRLYSRSTPMGVPTDHLRTAEPPRTCHGWPEDLPDPIWEQPPVILLDEPTATLGPADRVRFWRFLGRLRDQGHAVLVAMDLDDLDGNDCDRMYLLRDGAVVTPGGTPDVRETLLSQHSFAHPDVALKEPH